MKKIKYFILTRPHKIFSLLTLAVFTLSGLTSCIKENYPAPNRTGSAYMVYQGWEVHASNVLSLSDAVVKADKWLFATTQQERETIEDNNFRHFRLRQRGDTLYMQDYRLGRDYRLITDGNELSVEGASRRFIRAAAGGYDTVHLVRVADALRVRLQEPDREMSQQLRFDLLVSTTTLNGKEFWQMEGDGRFSWLDVSGGYDYTFDRKLTAFDTSSDKQVSFTTYYRTRSVALTIIDTHTGTPYPIKAEKSELTDLRITYRGFTGYPHRYL